MNDFTIHRADADDIVRVAPLFDAYRSFYGQPSDVARAAGLMLETGRDNGPARALYRAAGWIEDASQWYSLPLE